MLQQKSRESYDGGTIRRIAGNSKLSILSKPKRSQYDMRELSIDDFGVKRQGTGSSVDKHNFKLVHKAEIRKIAGPGKLIRYGDLRLGATKSDGNQVALSITNIPYAS